MKKAPGIPPACPHTPVGSPLIKALSDIRKKISPCVNCGMGFGSLGASSFVIIGIAGLGGPLKADDSSTLGTLDGDQVADHPSSHSPAGAGIDGQNRVRPLLQDDLPPDPPPAFAGVVIVTQGQGRPGQFCEFLSVMGAATFKHDLIKRQKTKMIKEHRQRLAVRGTKY